MQTEEKVEVHVPLQYVCVKNTSYRQSTELQKHFLFNKMHILIANSHFNNKNEYKDVSPKSPNGFTHRLAAAAGVRWSFMSEEFFIKIKFVLI